MRYSGLNLIHRLEILMRTFLEGVPGFLLVGILAAIALFLTQYIGLSVSLIAILLGFVVGNLLSFTPNVVSSTHTGIIWIETYGLSTAVALLGLQLNLSLLLQVNATSLSVIALAIVMTFLITVLLSKMFRIDATNACLLASGQAICGSAAVMAATKALNVSNKAQTGLIIAVINFLGFLGVFIVTEMGQYFFAGDEIANAFMIGNTLQSMGHVVAAGFGISEEVGQGAVLIKMCRILFLIPTLLVLVYWISRSIKEADNNCDNDQNTVSKVYWLKLVPLFIWVFLALILLNNLGWISQGVIDPLTQLSDVLFILAMVAIGLSIRVQDIWQQCSKLLLVAGVVFILQIAFTWVFLQWV